jgi:hypothetical protein
MKLIKILLLSSITVIFLGCNKPETDFYTKLKNKTGATDKELQDSLTFFTEFYVLMSSQIQDGTLKAEDLVEAAKNAKQAMATLDREDELAAAMTLRHLRILESKGIDQAKEAMAKQLSGFVEAESPSTENSQKIRGNIKEYALTSEAFRILKNQSEQAAPRNR